MVFTSPEFCITKYNEAFVFIYKPHWREGHKIFSWLYKTQEYFHRKILYWKINMHLQWVLHNWTNKKWSLVTQGRYFEMRRFFYFKVITSNENCNNYSCNIIVFVQFCFGVWCSSVYAACHMTSLVSSRWSIKDILIIAFLIPLFNVVISFGPISTNIIIIGSFDK